MWQSQCAHLGAIWCAAHSRLSNVNWSPDAVVTRKARE
jgi:hypothetical protein